MSHLLCPLQDITWIEVSFTRWRLLSCWWARAEEFKCPHDASFTWPIDCSFLNLNQHLPVFLSVSLWHSLPLSFTERLSPNLGCINGSHQLHLCYQAALGLCYLSPGHGCQWNEQEDMMICESCVFPKSGIAKEAVSVHCDAMNKVCISRTLVLPSWAVNGGKKENSEKRSGETSRLFEGGQLYEGMREREWRRRFCCPLQPASRGDHPKQKGCEGCLLRRQPFLGHHLMILVVLVLSSGACHPQTLPMAVTWMQWSVSSNQGNGRHHQPMAAQIEHSTC